MGALENQMPPELPLSYPQLASASPQHVGLNSMYVPLLPVLPLLSYVVACLRVHTSVHVSQDVSACLRRGRTLVG